MTPPTTATEPFTAEELRVMALALRTFAASREGRLDYDSAELAEDVADRLILAIEQRAQIESTEARQRKPTEERPRS
jgi:hypothetical protein